MSPRMAALSGSDESTGPTMSQRAPAVEVGRSPSATRPGPPTSTLGAGLNRSRFASASASVRPTRASPPHDGVNRLGARPSRSTSARTSPASRANVSALAPQRFQPSAPSAATRPTWRARPPTQIGYPRSRTARIVRRSAITRSASVPNGRPNVSISGRLSSSPAPSPTSRRGPAIRSTVSRPAASVAAAGASRARRVARSRCGASPRPRHRATRRTPTRAGSHPTAKCGTGGRTRTRRAGRTPPPRARRPAGLPGPRRRTEASTRASSPRSAGSMRSKASSAAPITPARSPSPAGTISGVGR